MLHMDASNLVWIGNGIWNGIWRMFSGRVRDSQAWNSTEIRLLYGNKRRPTDSDVFLLVCMTADGLV